MREDVVIPILLSAVVVAFPVALILFIIKYNQAKSENREAKRAGAFQGGSAGRARIVELRRAAVQRSDQFDPGKSCSKSFPIIPRLFRRRWSGKSSR
jgi:hypothetical protein